MSAGAKYAPALPLAGIEAVIRTVRGQCLLLDYGMSASAEDASLQEMEHSGACG